MERKCGGKDKSQLKLINPGKTVTNIREKGWWQMLKQVWKMDEKKGNLKSGNGACGLQSLFNANGLLKIKPPCWLDSAFCL